MMPFGATITKDFTFSASHRLDGLEPGHPCARMHGHNYLVRVEITGPIVAPGWVIDYGALRPFADWIDQNLDHRHLNDVPEIGNPTAELLACRLLGEIRRHVPRLAPIHLVAVSVSETPKTWARVSEERP